MATHARAILLGTTTSSLADSQTEALGQPFQQGLSDSDAWRSAKGVRVIRFGVRLVELLAPHAFARRSGVSNKRTDFIELYGLRELLSASAPSARRNRCLPSGQVLRAVGSIRQALNTVHTRALRVSNCYS